MNGELLAVLEHIEREKGIKKEILVSAVESALVSAAKKVIGAKSEAEIRVVLDPETGKISAYAGKEKIESENFGRIAAQTAKQVIIQKIREAEKDVIFNEFSTRVGEIVTGTVYRFEKGNIIVDLLGKTEGLLPKSEQSPKEEFRQGQRICAYVLDVKKETKGPQIILSRIHPNLVKKLFELEVPEIYESIVEIKSISREPGERTKIAVWSKDEKIDSVGACVGMRGSRVKNIVQELHGEKIDIVRWSGILQEYIAAALSPAKTSEVKIDKEKNTIEVIVENDQLSLAIGKHGQNVRLASKLLGWNVDIRTKAPAASKEEKATDLQELPGIGKKTAEALKEAGFDSLEKIAKVKLEELTKVKGIGKKKAETFIEQAKKLVKT
ncbi:MAG: transcription termination factor NusA [Candidatus Omnitrophota bacterium]